MIRRPDSRTVPVLQTPRLVLRGQRIGDFAALTAMWADPVVQHYIPSAPTTVAGSWERFLFNMAHWDLCGFGYWAVESRQDGRFAGAVGLLRFSRGFDPALERCPEAGWVFRSHARGRGYATEAVAAMLGWADRNRSDPRTVCIFDPAHGASRRVAERSGFVFRNMQEYRGETVEVRQRLRPETVVRSGSR